MIFINRFRDLSLFVVLLVWLLEITVPKVVHIPYHSHITLHSTRSFICRIHSFIFAEIHRAVAVRPAQEEANRRGGHRIDGTEIRT